MNNITDKNGFVECPKCLGAGIDYSVPCDNYYYEKRYELKIFCKRCKGIGKISWIENIFRK